MPKTRRLFFALWPSTTERAALQAALEAAHRERPGSLAGSGARVVPAARWHLTLAFLGAVETSRAPALLAAAAQVRSGPVAVTFDTLEHWPRAELVCATASVTPAPLEALAATLAAALVAAGFAPDLKPFRAHVTLMRKVARASSRVMPPVTLRFAEFALLESRTERAGATYSIEARWPLYEVARENP